MDDLLIDDDLLFAADSKLSRMQRLAAEVQHDLIDADYETRRELASIVTLLKRVKAKIPATMAAA